MRAKRKGGLEVWLFRWRETGREGKRRPRKIVVGSVKDLPTEAAARQTLETLRLNINLDLSEEVRPPRTFGELIEHYRAKELDRNRENPHKAFSTKEVYDSFLTNWIIPRWADHPLARMENGVAVHVEEWLRLAKRAPGTKAKVRNIMSDVCSHAMRYGWMRLNPITAVRQGAKPQRRKVTLEVAELQALFAELGLLERALVMLDVPTGMRAGELLALRWADVDFTRKQVDIKKSVWHQHVGPVKTEESEKVLPLDDAMIADLMAWRAETPYAQDGDWVFASPRMHGKQPFWPEALMDHIREAAKRAGINKHISWHVFRHTFATLLAGNGEDVKTVQALMRHANSRLTLDLYAHAVDRKKRSAQSKVVRMILPSGKGKAAKVGA